MKGRCILILFMLCNTIGFSQSKRLRSADGICIFNKGSADLFKFVSTNEWKVTPDQLIEILSYRVAYHFTAPYRGFINTKLFTDNYLDTLNYGYNGANDKRITTVYYCNCKLLFSDPSYNEKDLNLRYDKNKFHNKNYEYLYKGKPVRFYTKTIFDPPVDSVILFP